jgi:hypothetical protein
MYKWADFREGKGGIKMTVKLDHQGKILCFIVVSNARGHDVKRVRDVPHGSGDMLVFICGYADYGYFAEICGEKHIL